MNKKIGLIRLCQLIAQTRIKFGFDLIVADALDYLVREVEAEIKTCETEQEKRHVAE